MNLEGENHVFWAFSWKMVQDFLWIFIKNSWFSLNFEHFLSILSIFYQFWARFSLIFIDFSGIYYQISLIFYEFSIRGYSGIDQEFNWFSMNLSQFYYQFVMNFSEFWAKISFNFHWFSLKIGQFYYQIWLFQPKSIIFIFVPLFINFLRILSGFGQ